MTRPTLFGVALLVAFWPGSRAVAQDVVAEPFSVSVTVGTFRFGDLQEQPVLVERLGEDGGVTASSTLQRAMTASGGFHANGSAIVPLGAIWRARVGVGLGRTRLGASFSGPDAWVVDAAALEVPGHRGVGLVTGEAALRFMIPSRHALRPYLEVGASAERWRVDASSGGAFPGAGDLSEGATRVGAHAAFGGRYPVTDRVEARLQASMRALRTPLSPLEGGVEIARSDSLVMTSAAPATGPFADRSVGLVRVLRFEVGLSYALGAVRAARPDQSEEAGSTSAPHR